MCAACAVAAVSAASGARSYLAPRLTPRRLKMATIVLMVAALLGSTIAFSGSTPTSSAQASSAAPAHSSPAHD
jgi:hypothetical protein